MNTKFKYFYDTNGKLVATLVTDYTEGQFRAGLAIARRNEVSTKKMGKIIAIGRLTNFAHPSKTVDGIGHPERFIEYMNTLPDSKKMNYFVKRFNIPNRNIINFNGITCKLKDAVMDSIVHSANCLALKYSTEGIGKTTTL